jgi:glycosyltransferase involved in cell wall biosynthesis
MAASRKRLLLIVNDAGFFLSHRLPVALAARAAGFDVHVATGRSALTNTIAAHGLHCHELRLSRGGTNPIRELISFVDILRLLRRLHPEVLHLVTVKPVLYGGIAARITQTPAVVMAISGLGHVFAVDSPRTRTVRRLVLAAYRLVLGRDGLKVIFQNGADRDVLVRCAGLAAEKAVMIRGSGVDLHAFRAVPEPSGTPVVIFASRLLKSKGVGEFIEAARLLQQRGVAARFQLAGDIDPDNAASATTAELASWRSSGLVEVLGHRQDVANVLAASNLVALPSYYGEGLPKVLAEAAACGRAVVTTDMPGCRDAVEPNITGILVPPRDAVALADAIQQLLDDPARRRRMGTAARSFAEREFGLERIVDEHLALYRAFAP